MFKCDPKDDPFELNNKHIKQLLRLAKLRKGDIFYDLGCGSGRVVIQVTRRTKAKLAVGLDNDECQFRKTWPRAFRELRKSELWFTDFRLQNFEDYDYSDGTVIYYSLIEEKESVSNFRKHLRNKKGVRFITKDIPFIGYLPVNANRKEQDCWLFVSKYPFERTRDLRAWIKSVLGKPGTLDDLYHYYRDQMAKHYPHDKKYPVETLGLLKRLIKLRFSTSAIMKAKGPAFNIKAPKYHDSF